MREVRKVREFWKVAANGRFLFLSKDQAIPVAFYLYLLGVEDEEAII